ncbi:LysR family transcriptional regulator [Achromobacter xylosoxidans]|uniref:LysR family transcriptional regulator n=1 Tax=Alcaligenes xylosoxydans xylosoxydans TaxID=85698 RepID=UPI001F141CD9|nr:LysR family transcriptional regulator [Achromobacter xylosoxidans]
MPINELRAITIFAKTAELGSLRQAAIAQGISPQAASQALAQLEHFLGARLFHRTTRNMALTDAGQQFLEAARPGLIALQKAVQGVRGLREEIAGPLRIAGPRSTFLSVLQPVLDEFCTRYPAVQADVQLDDHIGNWVMDRVDVGFRTGTPPADGVIARRLFPLQLIICAAPRYLDRHGTPASLAELVAHRCSVYRHPNTGKAMPWAVRVDGNVVEHDLAPALCTNDMDLELQATLAGQVVAQLTGVMAAPHIRAGRLVPLLCEHVSDHLGVYIYYGSREAPRRARAFVELAIERLLASPMHVLSARELGAAQAGRGTRIRETASRKAK